MAVSAIAGVSANDKQLVRRVRHAEVAAAARDETQHLQKRLSGSGRATFYDPSTGPGNCGRTYQKSDPIVAMNTAQYAGGAHCFDWITITYQGKSVSAQITDSCPGCPWGAIDLSPGVFNQFASPDVGVIQVSWTDGAGGGGGSSSSSSSSSSNGGSSSSSKNNDEDDDKPTSSKAPHRAAYTQVSSSSSSQWTSPAVVSVKVQRTRSRTRTRTSTSYSQPTSSSSSSADSSSSSDEDASSTSSSRAAASTPTDTPTNLKMMSEVLSGLAVMAQGQQ